MFSGRPIATASVAVSPHRLIISHSDHGPPPRSFTLMRGSDGVMEAVEEQNIGRRAMGPPSSSALPGTATADDSRPSSSMGAVGDGDQRLHGTIRRDRSEAEADLLANKRMRSTSMDPPGQGRQQSSGAQPQHGASHQHHQHHHQALTANRSGSLGSQQGMAARTFLAASAAPQEGVGAPTAWLQHHHPHLHLHHNHQLQQQQQQRDTAGMQEAGLQSHEGSAFTGLPQQLTRSPADLAHSQQWLAVEAQRAHAHEQQQPHPSLVSSWHPQPVASTAQQDGPSSAGRGGSQLNSGNAAVLSAPHDSMQPSSLSMDS